MPLPSHTLLQHNAQACGVLVQGPTWCVGVRRRRRRQPTSVYLDHPTHPKPNPDPHSHPFCDDGAKGFLRAEGMGCVVLRRLPDAEASGHPVHCLIRKAVAASAGAADTSVDAGAGRVYEQPCPFGMRQMFLRAYESVGLPLKRLSYMECHATGTAVGDIIEVEVRCVTARVCIRRG